MGVQELERSEPRAARDLASFRVMVRNAPREAKLSVVTARCVGKKVLDCGIADHEAARAESPGWLHRRIRDVAKHVIGLDFLPREMALLYAAGTRDLVTADAHMLPFKEGGFDVVTAGDIIEHLQNPGEFLAAAHRVLVPGGEVVITTPNPFYINQFLTILTNNDVTVNDEHTQWFDPYTLRVLLERSDFEIVDFVWLEDTWGAWTPGSWMSGGTLGRKILKGGLLPFWLALGSLRLLRRRRRYLSSDFMIVGRKPMQ